MGQAFETNQVFVCRKQNFRQGRLPAWAEARSASIRADRPPGQKRELLQLGADRPSGRKRSLQSGEN
ncbi:hypothetical protein C3V36_11775 [Lachnospiraceae bacterium oral taxon 500]|nr:hypothetical protein C3V36_11775 [Lachnospiraceae bacterium oral taxon 500]